jgi:FixJ family two-component response regulator
MQMSRIDVEPDPSVAVFLVDPVSRSRSRLARVLAASGHRVQTFADAESVLAALQPRQRGCVVAEIDLPVTSGLDLLARLRERDDSLPVIFLSARADVRKVARAMRAGAFDFFAQPVVERELVARVDAALGGLPAPGRRDR